MLKVTVYDIRRRVELVLATPGTANWNLPMNDSAFKVFRGTQNSIEFVVRNNDRKPINLTGKTVVASLSDHHTGTTLAVLPMTTIDATRGAATLSLSAALTASWDLGFKTFAITLEDVSGSARMLFVDEHETARGFFEVMPGAENEVEPGSMDIVFGQVTRMGETYFVSDSFPGNLQGGNSQGNQTVSVSMTAFRGDVWIQGSVEDSVPSAEDEWFDVADKQTYVNETSSKTTIVTAQLNWLRVLFKPASNNIGTMDKVTFRN